MTFELPLFPLQTVLFPGMPLALHIFEPRYRQMVGECLRERQPFGVVLIREGDEVGDVLVEPFPIGCTAEIAQMQPLEDGRMQLLVIGRERFRILQLHHDQPYLTGTVEDFPLQDGGPENHAAVAALRPWVEEYLLLLSEAGELEFDATRLPSEPEMLAYLAATVLQVPVLEKQALLAEPAATNLLNDMRGIYRRELPLLRAMLQFREEVPAGPEPFSLN
ncbi:MAG: LON peptidase substrate-binding domain-containing protein [Anaerolineae bacterium]|nr:LON peptidase substrate-binding domain-containing protein [Anaerolineae bacterium]